MFMCRGENRFDDYSPQYMNEDKKIEDIPSTFLHHLLHQLLITYAFEPLQAH
jgi:hypothetical protein